MKKLAILASATLLLAATGVQAKEVSKKDAAAAINGAVNATLAAAKAKGEWRDTFKTIGKAKKAYKKGDFAAAKKLAGKATFQAEMGKKQAMGEKHAGIPKSVK